PHECQDRQQQFGPTLETGTGAEAVLELLRALDLPTLAGQLRARLRALGQAPGAGGALEQVLLRRLRIVEALRGSGQAPEWLVLRRLPVLPAGLRPMVHLASGKFASSEL